MDNQKEVSKLRHLIGQYPENIIREIGLEHVFGRDVYQALSEDQLAGLEYALSTLEERERLILEMRFKEGLSFAEIGSRFERSSTRMNQMKERAIRKLRRGFMAQYFSRGLQAVETKRQTGVAHIKRSGTKMTSDEIREALNVLAYERIDDMDIEARSVLCMTRSGIHSIFDLVEMIEKNPGALFRVRNVGERAFTDILEGMRKVGLGDWADLAASSTHHRRSPRLYPDNLMIRIGVENAFGSEEYHGLSADQLHGLEYAISTLKSDEQQILRMHFQERLSYSEIAERIGSLKDIVGRTMKNAIQELRRPFRAKYYIMGFDVVGDSGKTT